MAKPDKATLSGYIDELGLSDELKTKLLGELEANETAANQFVGQRLRQSDYTKKTTELADQRRQLDVAVTSQVKEYEAQLLEANNKIAKILKDFENEQISRSTAETRLRTLANKYEIPKEDLADLLKDTAAGAPPKTDAGGTTLTLEAVADLMKKREKELLAQLLPEMLSLSNIGVVQQDIRRQHQELTGKWLTTEEMNELTKEATKDNSGGLVKVWENKYEIPRIRGERHDKSVADKAIAEYQAEETRKASEAAIRTVHNQGVSETQLSTSPVLRQYRNRAEDGQPAGGTQDDKGGKGGAQGKEPQPRQSGAERAATRWVERRAKGIGLGKEEKPAA